MRRVVKVLPELGIATFEVDDSELSDTFIRANIGASDGKSWLERTSFFGIQGIDIVLDEMGKLKNLPPSLWLPDDVIAGDCIIVSLELISEEDGYGWFGLNEKQFDLVIEKLVF